MEITVGQQFFTIAANRTALLVASLLALSPGVTIAAPQRPAGRLVAGRLTTTDGQPLEYANVAVTGTSLGAFSHRDGVFVFRVPDGVAGTIRVTMIGYNDTTATLPSAGESDTLRIALRPRLPASGDHLEPDFRSALGAADEVAVATLDQTGIASDPQWRNRYSDSVFGYAIRRGWITLDSLDAHRIRDFLLYGGWNPPEADRCGTSPIAAIRLRGPTDEAIVLLMSSCRKAYIRQSLTQCLDQLGDISRVSENVLDILLEAFPEDDTLQAER